MALEENREFYFSDRRFYASPFNYKITDILFDIWLVILFAGGLVSVLSELLWLKYLGILIFLYLTDWTIHRNQARQKFYEMPKSGRINLSHYVNPKALSAILGAREASLLLGGSFLLRLTDKLLKTEEASEALKRLEVPIAEFQNKLGQYLSDAQNERPSHDEIGEKINGLLVTAFGEARLGESDEIEIPDLFAALGISGDKTLQKLFDIFDIDSGDLERSMVFSRFRKKLKRARLPSSLGGFASSYGGVTHRFMNRAWTARPTPTLDKFSTDFTDMARAGKIGFMIGHQDEYHELLDVLSRPNRPNAILVGEAGSGKDTTVGHLAYMVTRDEVPKPLFDKRVVALDLPGLLAGADQAELQNRLKTIFDEILRAKNIILYIQDVHNLSRTSEKKGLTAANTIIPIISSNDFPVVGSTYPREYKQFVESDSSFAEAFQIIQVKEVSIEEAEFILAYDSLLLEDIYGVEVTYGAIKKAVELAKKYFRDKLLPASADDLLKEALSRASHKERKILVIDDVIEIAERRVNVPLRKAGKGEAERLLNLEKIIHQNLVDQESAVSIVSRALREYRSGLSRKGGPIGTFLFVGPTGVGKTQLSKILAQIQFGSEESMARFDMSEYQEKQSISRFIGSSDGALSGSLTEAILEKPYSLILLDEFEKAHPDILNLFLQVFDDGRLTDALGRQVDFKNTIIIATSNAHSEFIKSSLEDGKTMETISDELKKRLTEYFKPELLNRFSSIVVFKALSLEDMEKISRLQLSDLSKDLKELKDVELVFTEEVVKKVAELGYDPALGARPLREVISEKLRGPLSEKFLRDEISEGDKVTVQLAGENFHFAAG